MQTNALRAIRFLLCFWLGWGTLAAASRPSSPPLIRAKDLAVLLPAAGKQRISPSPDRFPSHWWEALHRGFAATSIGAAMQTENTLADWRLVAMRFAPCQPLLAYLTPKNETLCWPELRLVWQPIPVHFPQGRERPYADDRAVHALYQLDPELLMPSAEAQALKALASRAEQLTPADTNRFATLQRAWIHHLTQELIALRTGGHEEDYEGLAVRPEFTRADRAAQFLEKLGRLLAKTARPERLKQLTAFSLPEGRDPPRLGEWVFLAFEPHENGQALVPQPLTIRSRLDGRVLADYGWAAQVTIPAEDDKLREIWADATDEAAWELAESVIWTPRDRITKASRIADPRQTHVGHTSCGSCHKLGNPPFDFHNLSYLEERPISISPRVIQDLSFELAWLRRTTNQ